MWGNHGCESANSGINAKFKIAVGAACQIAYILIKYISKLISNVDVTLDSLLFQGQQDETRRSLAQLSGPTPATCATKGAHKLKRHMLTHTAGILG